MLASSDLNHVTLRSGLPSRRRRAHRESLPLARNVAPRDVSRGLREGSAPATEQLLHSHAPRGAAAAVPVRFGRKSQQGVGISLPRGLEVVDEEALERLPEARRPFSRDGSAPRLCRIDFARRLAIAFAAFMEVFPKRPCVGAVHELRVELDQLLDDAGVVLEVDREGPLVALQLGTARQRALEVPLEPLALLHQRGDDLRLTAARLPLPRPLVLQLLQPPAELLPLVGPRLRPVLDLPGVGGAALQLLLGHEELGPELEHLLAEGPRVLRGRGARVACDALLELRGPLFAGLELLCEVVHAALKGRLVFRDRQVLLGTGIHQRDDFVPILSWVDSCQALCCQLDQLLVHP
mmetsp:Transcript_11847/g.28110  ORF Transcript_11847/g.28110 Transcript_11847/m.28110 type:complete len:351 (-) Transcript_11847:310-1362(-)